MSEQEKCGSCGDLEVECVCDDGLRRRFELPPKIDLRSAGEVARSVARAVFGVELPEGTEVLPWVSDTPFTVVGVRAVGGAGQIEVRVRYPREVLRRAMPVSAEEARALERIEVDAAERAEERQKAWEEGARYSVAAAEGEERPTDVQGFIVALAAVVKAAGLEPDRRPSKLIAQVGAALAAARALRAPVDVEGEANKIAGAILDAYRHEGSFGAAIDTVRPHVERGARLAREAEGLREEHRPHAVAHAVQLDVSADGLDLPQKRERVHVDSHVAVDQNVHQHPAHLTIAHEPPIDECEDAVDHYREALHRILNGEDPIKIAAEYSGQDPNDVRAKSSKSQASDVFTPTPEEVASCAVLAEVAGKPEREAVLYLASLVKGSREAYARRRAAQRAEDEEGPLVQARALLQRARIRLVDEPDSTKLHAEIDSFLAGLPVA